MYSHVCRHGVTKTQVQTHPSGLLSFDLHRGIEGYSPRNYKQTANTLIMAVTSDFYETYALLYFTFLMSSIIYSSIKAFFI